MKIMIVDDEIIVLQGLSKLISNAHPDYEIVCFSSAEDAISFCRDSSIDIIISDVQMPGMNGLELCKQIIKNTDARIIIISGYDNFAYAVEAIKLGASRYILKPIQQQEFLNALDETICAQKQTRKVLHTATTAKKASLQKELSDLANGIIPIEESYISPNPYRIGILVIYEITYGIASDTTSLLESIAATIAQTAMPDSLIEGFTQYQRGRCIFLLSGDSCQKDDLCIRLSCSLKESAFDFTLAFSNYHPAGMTLNAAVAEVQIALNQNSYSAENRLMFPSGKKAESQSTQQLHILAQHYADQLVEQITGEQTDLADKLSEIILASAREKHLSLEKTIRFLEEIMVLATAAFVYTTEEKVNSDFLLHCYFRHDPVIPSFPSLKTEFQQKLQFLTDSIRKLIDSSELSNQLTQKVDAIFDADPAKISLEYVSQKLGFSPAYFSVLFKKQAGCSFKDYLMSSKISCAKSLLASSTMSVSAIAKKLGYQNPDHFSKVFHKRAGISPSDYRKAYIFK